jgi:hypothetical protein
MSSIKTSVLDIKICFQNIDNFLQEPQAYGIENDLSAESVKIFSLVSSIDECYRLSKNLNASSVFDVGLGKLLEKSFARIDEEGESISKTLSTRFLLAMLSRAGACKNIWFFEVVRDNIFASLMNYHGKIASYFWLMTIYFYHLAKTDDEAHGEYNNFFKENPKPKNGFILPSWEEIVKKSLDATHQYEIQHILRDMLDFYGGFSKKYGIFVWRSSAVKELQFFDDGGFNKGLIIRCWLTLVLNTAGLSFSYGTEVKEPSLLDCLDKNERQEFLQLFNGGEDVGALFDEQFLAFCDIPVTPMSLIKESDAYRSVGSFRNTINWFSFSNENRRIPPNGPTQEKNEQDLKKAFMDGLSGLSFVEAKKNSPRCQQIFTNFTIERSEGNINEFLHALTASSLGMLQRRIFNDVKASPEYNDPKFKRSSFSKNDIESIKTFSAKGKCFSSGAIYRPELAEDVSKEDFQIINQIGTDSGLHLPRVLYYLEGGLIVYLSYSDSDSFVREFTDSELLSFIDDNFKQENGLYLFKRSINDPGSVFISKEEMIETARNRYLRARVVLNYELDLDKDKLLIFNREI